MKPANRFLRDDRLAFILASLASATLALGPTERQPYNFCVLTRWAVFLTSGWGPVRCWSTRWSLVTVVYAGLGLLSNPIAPFRFSRGSWDDLDVGANPRGLPLFTPLPGRSGLSAD